MSAGFLADVDTGRRDCALHKTHLTPFDSSVSLDGAWLSLEQGATSPTQSYAFSHALALTMVQFGIAQALQVESVEGCVALLALCRDRAPFARWRTLGSREVFEPIDALSKDTQSVTPLAEFLVRQDRAVVFDRLPAASPLVSALQAAIKGHGLVSIRKAVSCPTIALGDEWRDPEQCFNSGRRSDFRRAARKASALGTVTFEVLSPSITEFDALFDEAVAVEARSWKLSAKSALASDHEKRAFFNTFFGEICRQGRFRIGFMRINGQAIAMQMAVEWQDKYWLFKIGFDEEFKQCSPGTLLMLHRIGWAASGGLRSYELLGDVEPWISQLWTRDEHPCVTVRLYPFSMLGAMALCADGMIWAVQRLRAMWR